MLDQRIFGLISWLKRPRELQNSNGLLAVQQKTDPKELIGRDSNS
jgi:hypothetical protein